MDKRLYRSRKNRIIAGVAGGMAEYFDVDPTIARLVWVIALLSGGIGIALYIIAWIIIPEDHGPADHYVAHSEAREKQRAIGIWLIILGSLLIVLQLLPRLRIIIWPLALIAVGLWLLLRRSGND